ncbi:MAG TPA: GtrA family protein [Candidatus Parabacteroides intestinavium]|nr:GtrA family protein [Candidatus Parabacteroides intestinavium]
MHKNILFRQAIKFGIVGVGNTLITALVIWIMLKVCGFSDYVSNITGYGIGVLNSFVWNRCWTFHSAAGWRRSAVRFGIVFGISYLFQLGVLFVLNATSGIDPYYNQLLAMVFYTIANFILNKIYTFKE